MASANTLGLAIDRCLREGLWKTRDPGDAATIAIGSRGITFCEVVTATAETRVLPAAEGHGIGTKITVSLKTDGGDLTITGSDQTIVLTNAGEAVEFVVVDNNGTKVWRVSFDVRNTATQVDLLQSGITNGAVATAVDTATITSAQALSGLIVGTPTGAATYTFPTAALLVAAVNAIGAAAVGQIVRVAIHNNSAGANTITVAAGSGGTDEGTLAVAQDITRDFLIQLTNVTATSEAYFLTGIG